MIALASWTPLKPLWTIRCNRVRQCPGLRGNWNWVR